MLSDRGSSDIAQSADCYRAEVGPRLPTLQFVARPGILDLGWGHPHSAALPVRQWGEAIENVLTTAGSDALAYGYAAGPAALREWLAERTSTHEQTTCDPADVFVTAGASQALEMLACQSMSPGDVVIVDAPTYHIALRIIGDAGVKLVHAPVDERGIDPVGTADLIRALRRDRARVRFLYIVPTFCNPTGASLALDRRVALVDMADRLNLTILEDDTYREFAYDDAPLPALWSISHGECVIRIGSFAKTVAPGLRLGWINAPRSVVAALERRGVIDSGGGVNHMNAMAMAAFGSCGAFDRHLSEVRRRYAEQRDALIGALKKEAPSLAVEPPSGGWFVWVPLPESVSAAALLTEAEKHGVSFVQGSRFYVDGRGDDHIRLAFSMLGAADLAEAVSRLASALRVFGQDDVAGPIGQPL